MRLAHLWRLVVVRDRDERRLAVRADERVLDAVPAGKAQPAARAAPARRRSRRRTRHVLGLLELGHVGLILAHRLERLALVRRQRVVLHLRPLAPVALGLHLCRHRRQVGEALQRGGLGEHGHRRLLGRAGRREAEARDWRRVEDGPRRGRPRCQRGELRVASGGHLGPIRRHRSGDGGRALRHTQQPHRLRQRVGLRRLGREGGRHRDDSVYWLARRSPTLRAVL